jgi:hypothetical protein
LKVKSLSVPTAGACDSNPKSRACKAFDAPGGLVVNQRARYAVSTAPGPGSPVPLVLKPEPGAEIRGIDEESVLVVDYQRLPFASGRLEVTLDGTQAMKQVGIKSEPGEGGALEAVQSIVDADHEVRKARLEQKAKEEEAAGE